MNEAFNIRIQNLSIGYNKGHKRQRVVQQELNACARHATLTCIIGHNGAGKSTLLRTLARLQPAISGSIYFGNKELSTIDKEEWARSLSIVLTKRPDTKDMSVRELVALGRSPYTDFWGHMTDEDDCAVSQALEDIGLSDMWQRRASSLSDGEFQKAMIAKSLAQNTKCILLDEPTAFLDYSSKIELMLFLRRLASEKGRTILVSTHDLETALHTADQLWILDKNRISYGTPKELVEDGTIMNYINCDLIDIDKKTLNFNIKV